MPNEFREKAASIWDVMVLGQHHGLPTRLLDWSYSPPNIDDRIAFQRSIFSITKLDISIEDFLANGDVIAYKYIIPYKIKWLFRDFLDHANISERILFPGLDGLCKWLARSYYTERERL